MTHHAHDWHEWHRAPGPIRALSMCPGEGRDLLGVLEHHPRSDDVPGRLVELDPELGATLCAPNATVWTRHRRPPDVRAFDFIGYRALDTDSGAPCGFSYDDPHPPRAAPPPRRSQMMIGTFA